LRQYSMELWEHQIQLILQQNGLISFIVHPDYLLETRARDVYTCLLARLAQLREQSKVWIPLPRDLNDWWRSRNEMHLIGEEGQWQIQGPDSHRARVAFARLQGDRVVYGFDSDMQSHEIPTLASSQTSPAP
jgi:hypothetical protein